MALIPKHYSKSDLPFSGEMKYFWKENGFLIINDFYSEEECNKLRLRANTLVNKFNPYAHKSVFNTKKQEKNLHNKIML